MTCTFFGHRQFDDRFIPKLRNVIEDLILNYNVNKFYVGNHGNFDATVKKLLIDFKKIYPHITFYVVLSYLPTKTDELNIDYSYTITPEGFERVPRKAAIIFRNNWMLNKSDFVVAYITRFSLSSAAEFFLKAEKLNKICINIAK